MNIRDVGTERLIGDLKVIEILRTIYKRRRNREIITCPLCFDNLVSGRASRGCLNCPWYYIEDKHCSEWGKIQNVNIVSLRNGIFVSDEKYKKATSKRLRMLLQWKRKINEEIERRKNVT